MSVYLAALMRAAEIIGGRSALAEYLDVPPERLDAWLAGAQATPPDVFLRSIDVITDHGLTQARDSGAGCVRCAEAAKSSRQC